MTELPEQLLEETRRFAAFMGFEPPPTAEVFGPDTYFRLVTASSGDGVRVGDHLRERTSPFYLVVLRGEFVATRRRTAPRGTFATLIWSPVEDDRELSLKRHEPDTMSRLGKGRTLHLD